MSTIIHCHHRTELLTSTDRFRWVVDVFSQGFLLLLSNCVSVANPAKKSHGKTRFIYVERGESAGDDRHRCVFSSCACSVVNSLTSHWRNQWPQRFHLDVWTLQFSSKKKESGRERTIFLSFSPIDLTLSSFTVSATKSLI